mgnify:CR=1 FL=1
MESADIIIEINKAIIGDETVDTIWDLTSAQISERYQTNEQFGISELLLRYKGKAKQTLSSYLFKNHKEKEGTPTMGGIIFMLAIIICVTGTYIYLRIKNIKKSHMFSNRVNVL